MLKTDIINHKINSGLIPSIIRNLDRFKLQYFTDNGIKVEQLFYFATLAYPKPAKNTSLSLLFYKRQ